MITVDKKELRKAIKFALPAIDDKSKDDVLRSVRLRVSGQRLEVTGTDCFHQRTARLIGEGGADGAIAVPPRHLLKCFGTTGKVTLSMEADLAEPRLNVLEDAGGESHSSGYQAKDFPIVAAPSAATHTSVKCDPSAVRGFVAVSKWASKDDSRYCLLGACLEPGKDGGPATLTATNGHGLCSVNAPMFQTRFPLIIPSGLFAALEATAKSGVSFQTPNEPNGAVCAFWDDGAIEYEVAAKPIDGTYPDWRRIVPTDNSRCETFSRAKLAAIVKETAITGAKAKCPAMKFERGKAEGVLTVTTIEGTVRRVGLLPSVSRKGLGDEFNSIGFNFDYMRRWGTVFDLLGVDDEITFAMANADSPILITTSRPDVVAVLMPMRI